MYALVTTPPKVSLVEVDAPVPHAGEVLVRVIAAGVNPVDAQTVDGLYHRLGWLQRETVGLGWDVAGEVLAVGEGVRNLAVGDLVAGLHAGVDKAIGTFADHVLLSADVLSKIPEGLDPVGAATVPLNALTAAQALDLFGEQRGTLLVTGAAGAVGGFAVPLAARLGFDVTGLARESDADFVVHSGAKFVTELGEGYDAVFDAAGLGEGAVGAVRDGGRYVGVLPPALPAPTRGITPQAVLVASDGARLEGLLALAGDGELVIRIAETRPLADGAAAIGDSRLGGRRGRIVLTP